MKEDIKRILKKITGDENFDKEKNLITDGYIDSFDMLKLVMELEEYYRISIPIKDIEPGNFNSIDQISQLVRLFSNDG